MVLFTSDLLRTGVIRCTYLKICMQLRNCRSKQIWGLLGLLLGFILMYKINKQYVKAPVHLVFLKRGTIYYVATLNNDNFCLWELIRYVLTFH